MSNTGIRGGDYSSVIDYFDGIGNSFMNDCWVYFEFSFSGWISSVHRLVKRSLSTVAVVAWAMRRLQILFSVVPFLTPYWLIRGSGEPRVRPSTIVIGFIYVKMVVLTFFSLRSVYVE